MSSRSAASVTAVIAAAGSGERLGAGGPKAFVPLAGRPMVEWSIEAFGKAGVAAIVVACPPGHAYEPEEGASLPETRVVEGGATRSASVANAMKAVKTDLVAIHDAARPLLTPELAAGVVATLTGDPEAAGAIAAVPVLDTIKRVEGTSERGKRETSPAFGAHMTPHAGLVIAETLDRSLLWAAQTPQVFRVDALRAALTGDPEEVAAATDEAMLVEAAGGRVLIHPASSENLKVTAPLDLRLAEQQLVARAANS
jgi:2-C-methyl-D-erythritol 4-phosphate cytidylyltransferase